LVYESESKSGVQRKRISTRMSWSRLGTIFWGIRSSILGAVIQTDHEIVLINQCTVVLVNHASTENQVLTKQIFKIKRYMLRELVFLSLCFPVVLEIKFLKRVRIISAQMCTGDGVL
jgi:hypothetical protein